MLLGENHKAKECFSLKAFATDAMKVVAPSRPPHEKGKDKKMEDKEKDDGFQDVEKEVACIFGGPDAYDSKCIPKLTLRDVNVIACATP